MDKLQKSLPHICWCQWDIMCKERGENSNHIFLHCKVVEFLWVKLRMKAGVFGPLILVDHYFFNTGWRRKGRILSEAAMATLFWVIWKEWNKRIFSDKFRNLGELWVRIFYLA